MCDFVVAFMAGFKGLAEKHLGVLMSEDIRLTHEGSKEKNQG